jgi:MoaA/NifB/PqqE/SkfB family radical SAM enzyme
MCSIWLKQKGTSELSLAQIDAFFAEPLIAENVQRLILTGGEPTMRADLCEIAQSAAARLKALENVAFISNGLNFDRVIGQIRGLLEAFPQRIAVNFGFSLDGIGETHGKVRGVPGAFDKTMRAFRETKKIIEGCQNRTTSLGMTISSLNFSEAREICALANSEGVRSSFTTANVVDVYLDNADRADGFALNPGQREEVARFFDWLEQIEPNFYNRMVSRMLRGEARPVGCAARTSATLLDVDGAVYPCGQSRKMCYGNILREPFEQIWLGENARRVRQEILAAECPRCMTNCYPDNENEICSRVEHSLKKS